MAHGGYDKAVYAYAVEDQAAYRDEGFDVDVAPSERTSRSRATRCGCSAAPITGSRCAKSSRSTCSAPPTPRASSRCRLLQAIHDDLDDVGVRAVLADLLRHRGDPRGAFVALQIQNDTTHRASKPRGVYTVETDPAVADPTERELLADNADQ